MLKYLLPDRFVMLLIGVIVLASILPIPAAYAALANFILQAAIFTLFFLHGLRLPKAQTFAAMRNWKVQVAAFGFVFGAMPLAGLALQGVASKLLPQALVWGIVFLTILPTTIQSSISYAAIAKGNVAASVMASALLNIIGIFLTPLLVVALIHSDGAGSLGWGTAAKILAVLLLPFILGQWMQRWLGAWAMQQKAMLSVMDKGAIATSVYVSFSASVNGGLWSKLDAASFAWLNLCIATLLAFAFGAGWWLGKLLDLPRDDRISLLFAASHKSISSGAPMAAILFNPDIAGFVILPTLIYHLLQLIISAPVAQHLARRQDQPNAAA